jgi:uncharacterized repeat protein (TIGR04052 family)
MAGMKNRLLPLLLPLLCCACGLAQSAAGAKQPVRIRFEGRLADKPFACGREYEGVGSKAATVTPADLRFFVSNLELLGADGSATAIALDQDGVWQYKSIALIDLENGSAGCRNGNSATHAEASGTIPPGAYIGVRFTLGLPFELNHMDDANAPSPLNMTAMQWNWQNGYKFLRAEVALVSRRGAAASTSVTADRMPSGNASPRQSPARMQPSVSGFPVHLGSTGCAGKNPEAAPAAECKNPNRVVVTLPEFDVAKDVVVFDLGRLLAHSDLTTNAPNTAPGCMSGDGDPDCAPIMEALGLAYGNAPAKSQVVFYRRPE